MKKQKVALGLGLLVFLAPAPAAVAQELFSRRQPKQKRTPLRSMRTSTSTRW